MNKEDILFRSANKSLYCKVLYTPFCKTKILLNKNINFEYKSPIYFFFNWHIFTIMCND